MKTKQRLKLRSIFTVLGLLGLCIVLLLNRHQLDNFFHLVKSLRWYVVLIIIAVQIASYWVNALYYRSILKIFRHKLGLVRLFEGALATNFVNYVLPSAGVAGAGFLSQVLTPEVPRGVSVLTQLMRYALSGLAVLIMMPVGILLVFLSVGSGRSIVRVTLYSAFGIILFAIVIISLIQQEKMLRRLADWASRKLCGTLPRLRIVDFSHFINEFYASYRRMTRQKVEMLVPFGWSIIYIVIEILTFYMAFLAFGKVVNLGIVVMAYLFANIASIFGGVFFSTGVFELGMAGTLVALGMPISLSFAVTVTYRVLNLAIGLPPGFYFYKKYLP